MTKFKHFFFLGLSLLYSDILLSQENTVIESQVELANSYIDKISRLEREIISIKRKNGNVIAQRNSLQILYSDASRLYSELEKKNYDLKKKLKDVTENLAKSKGVIHNLETLRDSLTQRTDYLSNEIDNIKDKAAREAVILSSKINELKLENESQRKIILSKSNRIYLDGINPLVLPQQISNRPQKIQIEGFYYPLFNETEFRKKINAQVSIRSNRGGGAYTTYPITLKRSSITFLDDNGMIIGSKIVYNSLNNATGYEFNAKLRRGRKYTVYFTYDNQDIEIGSFTLPK